MDDLGLSGQQALTGETVHKWDKAKWNRVKKSFHFDRLNYNDGDDDTDDNDDHHNVLIIYNNYIEYTFTYSLDDGDDDASIKNNLDQSGVWFSSNHQAIYQKATIFHSAINHREPSLILINHDYITTNQPFINQRSTRVNIISHH